MAVYVTKWFARFARREGLHDADLCAAVKRAEEGLIDADLGGGVIKQRIARPGEGKSGGYRSIVVFKVGSRAVFVYGFAKNRKGNVSRAELEAFKALAQELLGYDAKALKAAVKVGALKKVDCNDE